MEPRLTDFQRRCIAHLEKFLKRRHTTFEQTSGGKSEFFIVLSFEDQSRDYEIYVYEDEIGYSEDDSWKIWEIPDYDSTSDLFAAFLYDLKISLGLDSPPSTP